jgi:hypothetical protein
MAASPLPQAFSLCTIPEDSLDLLSDFSPESSPHSKHFHAVSLKQSTTDSVSTKGTSLTSIIDVAEANWLETRSEVVHKQHCSCTCELF